MRDMRVLVFSSGGDWADASVETVVLTSGTPINALREAFLKTDRSHFDFPAWLIEQGAGRKPTEEEVLDIHADDLYLPVCIESPMEDSDDAST